MRDALIDRASGVLADDEQDDCAVVTALVTIARIAVADPPVIAPARATELYDEIADLAHEPRHRPPSDPHTRPPKEGSLRASAVQACILLAARSNGARTKAARDLLKISLRSISPEVRRTAKRLASALDDA